MHELAVGRALLQQVVALAAQRGAQRVSGITLQVGPLSGIEPALLRAAFEQLRVDTVAERAALVIAGMPVRIRCKACGTECETAPNRLDCPCCGSPRTILLGGEEMLIESVDLVFGQRPATAKESQDVR